MKRTKSYLRWQSMLLVTKDITLSFEYKNALINLAKRMVPRYADWCAIDLFDSDNVMDRVAEEGEDTINKTKLVSRLAFPLEAGENVYGALSVSRRKNKGEFNQKEVDFLRALCDHAALLIDNSQLVSQLRRDQIYLKKNEQKFRAIFRNSQDAIFLVNKDFLITDVNPCGRRIIGRTKNEILKHPIQDFFSGSFVGEKGEVEDKKNSSLYEYIIAKGLSKQTKILFLKDITERKTEEARQEHFLGIAGHELKNPLSAIKAMSHVVLMLLEKTKNKQYDEVKNQAKKINEKVDTLVRLIDELLDITRIRQGKIPLAFEKVSFEELIKANIYDFSLTNKSHAIVLAGSVNKTVYLDRQRISEVVINLLSNAVKYSPASNTVIVSIKSISKKKIICSVRDFGIGIAEEDQKKIFDLYYRRDISKTKHDGLGVGLFISKGIIKAHKGKIWVRSKPNKGSEFGFSLPVNNNKNAKKDNIIYR